MFDIYANSADPDSGYFVAYTAAKTMKAFVQSSIFLIWNFLLLPLSCSPDALCLIPGRSKLKSTNSLFTIFFPYMGRNTTSDRLFFVNTRTHRSTSIRASL